MINTLYNHLDLDLVYMLRHSTRIHFFTWSNKVKSSWASFWRLRGMTSQLAPSTLHSQCGRQGVRKFNHTRNDTKRPIPQWEPIPVTGLPSLHSGGRQPVQTLFFVRWLKLIFLMNPYHRTKPCQIRTTSFSSRAGTRTAAPPGPP